MPMLCMSLCSVSLLMYFVNKSKLLCSVLILRVLIDEVLCVEKFKVDVFCSFASALSCSNALACCGVCVDA